MGELYWQSSFVCAAADALPCWVQNKVKVGLPKQSWGSMPAALLHQLVLQPH